MVTPNNEEDEYLTAKEMRLVSKLPVDAMAKIDAAILAKTDKRYRKVAYIVGSVMGSIPNVPKEIPDVYYAQRIAHLVEAGQLEARGNLRRMRFSEVRLPSPPLSQLELQQMIEKADYWALGSIYESGQGVPIDYNEALKWYQKAADQGEIWSQLALVRFYAGSYGLKKDLEQACFWLCLFNRNSENKYPLAATETWDEITKSLTNKRIAELKQRAEEWKPNKQE